MLTSATRFEHHFSGLIASLSLYETGTFDILDITPKVAALDRPGAAAELAEAFRRGQACTGDFSALDHLARSTIRSTTCGATAASHHAPDATMRPGGAPGRIADVSSTGAWYLAHVTSCTCRRSRP